MNTIAERAAVTGALIRLKAELIALQIREVREQLSALKA